MMRSLFSGVSGLKSHQTRMDVIGNNIANVNTTGFKSSRTTFADMISQNLQAASAPATTRGGINPKQIGLGTSVASIDLLFTDGSPQSTGKNTDLALSGNGLFVMKNGNQTYYTRDGAFEFDGQGNYVLPGSGLFVQGWMGNNGVIDTAAAVGNIVVQAGKVMPAQSSTLVNYTNNLNADIEVITALTDGTNSSVDDNTITTLTATSDTPVTLTLSNGEQIIQTEGTYSIGESIPLTTTVTMYDSLGSTHDIPVYFKKIASNVDTTGTSTNVTQLDTWLVTLTKSGLTNSAGDQLYDTGSVVRDTVVNSSGQILYDTGTTATVGGVSYPIYSTSDNNSAYSRATITSATDTTVQYLAYNATYSALTEYVANDLATGNAAPIYTTASTDANGKALSPVQLKSGTSTYYTGAYADDNSVVQVYLLSDSNGNPLYDTGKTDSNTGLPIYSTSNNADGTLSRAYSTTAGASVNYVLGNYSGNALSTTQSEATAAASSEVADEVSMSVYKFTEDNGTLTNVNMPVVTLQFTNTGAYYSPASSNAVTTLTYTNGAQGTDGTYLKDNNGNTIATEQNVTLSFINLTQYTGGNTIVGTANGNAAGTLSSIQVDATGTIIGSYTNGVRQNEAQVAVAQFTNASGLTKIGSSMYQESNNSGVPNIKTASDLGVEITPSALEMSNVDVATEFADMIVTQRGFQSNSKIITVGDEMLETVINMKR